MPVSLEHLLDLKTFRAQLPTVPTVEKIQWIPIVDHAGDDAYEITVIIPDDTPPEHLERTLTRAIEQRIRQELRDAGITEFAYMRTLRPLDIREAEEIANAEAVEDEAAWKLRS